MSAGSGAESGDIDLLWRDLATGAQGGFELANQLQQDDHDSASLTLRPDGRYLAMYAKHGGDNLTRWRVSVNPNDPTAWQPEQTLNNNAGTTYNNTYLLAGENGGAGRMYNFTRAVNYDPNVQVSYDQGSTWHSGGKLLTEGGSGDRPYVRYAASDDTIFVMSTDRHPRDYANSVYTGYVRDGKLYAMDGTVVDGDIFDTSAVAPSALTPLFRNGSPSNGTTMNRGWTISMEVDNTGNPVGIFSARANDSDLDHRFFYSRFDGVAWQVHELARAGGYLYAAENDYTGLASIDPDNPNVVYVSTKINPTTNATTAKYELYKGVTGDFGATWAWTAITADSPIDNLRPIVPSWNGESTAVLWMRGTYTSYTNWNTSVVGTTFAATDSRSLLWRGTPAGSQSWSGGTGTWDSGGGAITTFRAGDEVAFGDGAVSSDVTIPAPVAPMGTAFSNRTQSYRLSGASIGGRGGLRVIGGGTVTLANGRNTFSGDTLVARGTLVLSGSAALAGTSRITIAEGATFDVASTSAGGHVLAGQSVSNAGHIRGAIVAEPGSSVSLVSSSLLTGDLTATGAGVVAEGTVVGRVALSTGATLRIGSTAITQVITGQQSVYVDATHGGGGNTTRVDGSAFTPTTNPDWQIRSPYANGGVVYQGGSDSPTTAATLKTTISGLVPGRAYHLYANYWDATGSSWRILAGTSPGSLRLFDAPADAVAGATDGLDPRTLGYATLPMITESNRSMWAADLGTMTADANGRVAVFVDDTGTADGDDRTWYDGVTYSTEQVGYAGQSTLNVSGDFIVDATSRLVMEVGSATAHDTIAIGGQASFGGTLEVDAVNAADLQAGDRVPLFEVASSTGAFDAFDLPALASGLAWDTRDLYRTGALGVVNASAFAVITLDVASGAETQARAGLPVLSGTAPLAKVGGGTLVINRDNPLTGETRVEDGTLHLAHAEALAASTIVPLAGGTVSIAPGLATRVGGLRPAAGGTVDLGTGGLTVAAGLSASDAVAAILAGRGDGSWNGTGITSSAAAAAALAGVPRGVGWLEGGDGSITLAYAAPGDTNLDGMLDLLDVSEFIAAARYDNGAAANWGEGDYTYDGVSDILDVSLFLSTGLFDAGTYTGSGMAVRVVPEPAFGLLGVAVVTLAVTRRRVSGDRVG